jgi:hypothetical protein
MTDRAGSKADEPGAVFRLIYRSHSLIGADERRTQLGEIFTTARRTNRELDITGALVLADDAFVQALEGDEQAVRGLYARIARDPRHDHCSVLEEQSVDGRTFGRWAMAEVSAEGKPDIRLMSNASKGVIVLAPGQDPSITPEQETVLAFMRAALTQTAA